MCGNPPNYYNTLQTKRGLLRSFLPRNDVTFLAEWHPSKHYVIANVVRQSPIILIHKTSASVTLVLFSFYLHLSFVIVQSRNC